MANELQFVPPRLSIGNAVAGGVATRILYVDANGNFGQSANFVFDVTNNRVTVGTGSGTSAGFVIGYSGASGYGDIWPTAVGAVSVSNYALAANANDVLLNAPNAAGTLYLNIANATKLSIAGTAGAGPSITAGTATTDVNALSITQTWNAAGVAFTGLKFVVTDTASAAGALAIQILGGASGTTNLFSVSKGGSWASGTNTIYDGVNTILSSPGQFRAYSLISQVSGSNLSWTSSTTDANPASNDTNLSRISAGVIGVGTGAAGSIAGTISANTIHSGSTATGVTYSRLAIKHATTSVTCAVGATVTATNLIPAKANVLGVNTVVTTAIGNGSGTTGYTVGDGTDADRWGVASAITAGTDTDGSDATANPTGWFTAANNVVITAAGGNFDGTGVIFIDVMYTVTEAD